MKKLIEFIAITLLMFLLTSCNMFKKTDSEPNTDPDANQTPSSDNEQDDEDKSDVHVHAYGEWVISQPATCGKEGLLSRTCTDCGAVEENKILPTGVHKQAEDAAVAPTCTSIGLSSGVHCSECGMIIIAQQKLPMVDHTYSGENDGTCNKCGFTRDIICAHEDLLNIPSKEATCTESGLTESTKCANCMDIITPPEYIPARGHTEVVTGALAPTCTEAGYTVSKTCSVCNEVLLKSSAIAPTGHKSTEWIIEIEPTETTEGLKYKVCTVCETRFDDTSIPFVGANGIAYEPNAIGNTCTVTGIGTFSGEELYIPDYIAGYRVNAIGDKAFQNCTGLTKLVLPETVKTIGNEAFAGCTGITEFTIPASVTYIGNNIFDGNVKMTTVYYNSTYIPSNYYESIYYHGILNSSYIVKVVFNGTFVPVGVVNNCDNIEKVEFGNNVTEIMEGAFWDCDKIKNIDVPGNVVSIGVNAFWDCDSLSDITLSEGLETIGDEAFLDLPIENIEIPYGVTYIGNYAFESCDLKSIVLPETLISVGNYVFKYCSSLKEVSIPNSLSKIGNGMFEYCGITSIVIPGTVTDIGAYAFANCPLVNVIVSEGVTTIGSYAFYDCPKLTGIVIPKSITTIEREAFRDCISLTDVYYAGTQSQWSSITIDGNNNEYLINAEKHFNYVIK